VNTPKKKKKKRIEQGERDPAEQVHGWYLNLKIKRTM